MFLSLCIIFGLGVLGGMVFNKIKIPKLIWYIILGILIGPSVLNIVDETLINISSYLRQIALVIILTRSGLNLDLNNLKKIGRPAILLSFVPAIFEMLSITIFGPILLKINYVEAILLGSVIAAVSPAIVVPRMIKLKEEGYGRKKCVAELVLAGASCDDIIVIILFYSFLGLAQNNQIQITNIIQIPISIILGILFGIICGIILSILFKKSKINNIYSVIMTLSISFMLLALEELLKSFVSISSLLAIIVMAIVLLVLDKEKAKQIGKTYTNLWSGFEILLFTLVGISTNISYALSQNGLIILGLIVIGLIFRSIGVILCLLMTRYTLKERIFIILSYLPKATVQASIGGIALASGLNCGDIVLTAAVISILFTAPIGAILIDNTYKRLLDPPSDDLIQVNI